MLGCEYNEKLAAASNSGVMSRGESDWTISYAESSNSTEYQFPGQSFGRTQDLLRREAVSEKSRV